MKSACRADKRVSSKEVESPMASLAPVTAIAFNTSAFKRSEQSPRAVVEQHTGLAAYVDAGLDVRCASPGLLRFLGLPRASIEGVALRELFGPKLFARVEPGIRQALAGVAHTLARPLALRSSAAFRRVHVTLVPARAHGVVGGFYAFCVDPRATGEAERQLERERERSLVTLQSVSDAVITVDPAGRVDYMNPVAQRLTGWDYNAASGRAVREVLLLGAESTQEAVENPVDRCLAEGSPITLMGEHVLCARNGDLRAVDLSVSPYSGKSAIAGAVIVFRDVGATRHLAQQLSWQAEHDTLTGLWNRRHFERCLELALESAQLRGEHHAILYVDLDQFKIVNDNCGHTAGDRLLREVSHIVSGFVGGGDVAARLGGDEFGLLLRDRSIAEALEVAGELRRAIDAHRFVAEGKNFAVGASIGVVPVTDASISPGDVLRAADGACYLAKDRGRNRVHCVEVGDKDLKKREDEMRWVALVRRALDDNRLCLYGQPIVPLGSTGVSHVEVLVRMRSETGEIVPPMLWIPPAERYGLMPEVDRWVIRATFQHLARRRAACTSDRSVCSINLSGTLLSEPDVLEFVRRELSAHGVDPAQVCFEITETAAIANLVPVQRFMTELRAIGVRFSLDDFGSGMSSFGYLKALPVDYLKIDGAFVRRIAIDKVDYAMVEAINNVGHVMNIRTVAEFVENEAIYARLKLLGVDYAQGHFIAMPAPLEEVGAIALPRPVAALLSPSGVDSKEPAARSRHH
jgi:diguanylate cyclase (GGDEF)-like protein/PAS domain S-box-containing protein